MSEWAYLRAGFVVVGVLIAAALVAWGVATARYEDPRFEQTRRCLLNEKGATLETPRDPIAASAELGALRTVIETNGVTVAVGSSREEAERVMAAYRAVGGDLGERLEVRGTTVYLWDRPPSPTQRQTLFDCTY
ncbi:MAG: hypothetical protein ACYC1P_05910 [Gaiellaceae bacterium]